MVTLKGGYIPTDSDQGVYALDTRFMSFYQSSINRVLWEVITSSPLTFYAARFHLTTPTLKTEGGRIEAHTFDSTLNCTVSEGVHEEFAIVNQALEYERAGLRSMHDTVAKLLICKCDNYMPLLMKGFPHAQTTQVLRKKLGRATGGAGQRHDRSVLSESADKRQLTQMVTR
jgi:N-terminal domain of (some) glycogen debranching enzymes